MAQAAVSEEEFIRLWNEYQSPTLVARAIGTSARNASARRDRIEATRGIKLRTLHDASGALNKESPAVKLVMSARKDIHRMEIHDGVIVVGSDAHYAPGRLSTAHKALCNLVFDLGAEISAVILNGDILDGGTISRHPADGWRPKPTVKQELDAVIERTSDIESAAAPGVKLLRTYGNHCSRFEARLAAQVPEYKDVAGFTMAEHLPKWIDSQRIDINGDTVIVHDWHSGLHSAWNDVVKGGCSVVTGHTHELGFKAHVGFMRDKIHYGVKTGMLADDDQDQFDYRKGKPGFNWRSGFAVLTWRDGILLQPEFCAVERDGCAYFRGKRYA